MGEKLQGGGFTAADITIVLPTRGRRELVAQRLQEVRHRPLLLVVDQGRRELDLPAELHGALVIECSPGCGSVAAFAAGILAATTPLVQALDDDAEIITPNFVEEMLAVYARHFGRGRGVVGATDEVEGGGHQMLCGLFHREFYLAHVHPAPYRSYFADTEVSSKARHLGLFAHAPHARYHHHFAGGQDRELLAAESKVFDRRMREFRAAHPGTRKALIAIPTYGGIPAQFVMCLLRLVNRAGRELGIHLNADSSVCRSRNMLAAIFLENPQWTDLLYIDSDVLFSPEQVERLLAHDLDIVGGFYPKKQSGPAEYVYNAAPDSIGPRADGLMRVSYMGTGFLRIRRKVLEVMIEHEPGIKYATDHDPHRQEHAFFVDQVRSDFTGRTRYLTEDWNFCQRALDLGFQIWGDTKILLQHVGPAIFPIQNGTHFAPATKVASSDRAVTGVIAPTHAARKFHSLQPA